jgi:Rha family phage regulatory protein
MRPPTFTRITAAGPAEATMSTREIAELTGKEHRNVLRDTRAMLYELEEVQGGRLSFEQSYLNEQNRLMPEFLLPKRETLILVSGYSVELRARIIDRWQELEKAQAAPQVSLSDPAALREGSPIAPHPRREKRRSPGSRAADEFAD